MLAKAYALISRQQHRKRFGLFSPQSLKSFFLLLLKQICFVNIYSQKKAEKEKEEWPYGLEDIPAFGELFGDS
ncbi:hypothetical protein PORCAN_787 [Porphyromonas crevioricanis JCM 13913]|nr:hypothetical protein PORCAN_787 [Porphyromonas crevioricanis JCM 13913]